MAKAPKRACMVALPDLDLLKRQPKIPHVARVVASREVDGITYTVKQGRSGRDYWISASMDGLKMSDTLHTSKPEIGAKWALAVKAGAACIKK